MPPPTVSLAHLPQQHHHHYRPSDHHPDIEAEPPTATFSTLDLNHNNNSGGRTEGQFSGFDQPQGGPEDRLEDLTRRLQLEQESVADRVNQMMSKYGTVTPLPFFPVTYNN
ncbi:hypothetical protein ElyMa_006796500 [Elysia marginata]|uniref:Uncharacterized protein n=1 Tax=Elysia marginata TaxID=1093978 RepID=A0AAV4J3D2_9GAST|nr:hypothetical protein ElyMa_006796500 [Elysia marginata]